MQKTLQRLTVALGLFAVANSAMAVITSGTVQFTGSYANGDVFVTFTSAVMAEPGCTTQKQFFILASNPGAKQLLTLATTAQELGKTLTVNTTGCYGSYPKVDAAGYLYIY